ncbi:MAG: 16S rRNA (uracil(1498)-N(3))-methyltransferase [Pseudomonadaceae bacterium]|nr:16S rRNA (uracil(1498)-N(3))-methyltransferase [Pseudomonadaceae bacterium]
MPLRFLIPEAVSEGQSITLAADRAHYLTKVMRHKAGDLIECFDGNGGAFDAQLSEVSNKRCTVTVSRIKAVEPRPDISLALGISLLKGQAMDRAIQQATELGASSICLINANRCNVHLSAERLTNKMGHWEKIIAAACEQSGQLFVPLLEPPQPVRQLIDNTASEVIVLDMHGKQLPASLPNIERLLLMGPEGGWDDEERSLFAAHQLPAYQLSASTLRAETVPAVALALFSHLQQL